MDKLDVLVSRTRKSPVAIKESMSVDKTDLLHAVSILSAEVGEVQGLINKHVFYNIPLDVEALLKELGDVEYGMQAIYEITSLKRSEALKTLSEKLNARYPNGTYSDAEAIAKADTK